MERYILAVSLKPDADDEDYDRLSDRAGALFDGTGTAPISTDLRALELSQPLLKALEALPMTPE